MLLLVSPSEEDHAFLRHAFTRSGWTIHSARTCGEALPLAAREPVEVVVSERNLPDGDWRDVHRGLSQLVEPPCLIVASRLADDSLWAEVLSLGGYDLLSKPFDEAEVRQVVHSARLHWKGRWGRPSIREAAAAGAA